MDSARFSMTETLVEIVISYRLRIKDPSQVEPCERLDSAERLAFHGLGRSLLARIQMKGRRLVV